MIPSKVRNSSPFEQWREESPEEKAQTIINTVWCLAIVIGVLMAIAIYVSATKPRLGFETTTELSSEDIYLPADIQLLLEGRTPSFLLSGKGLESCEQYPVHTENSYKYLVLSIKGGELYLIYASASDKGPDPFRFCYMIPEDAIPLASFGSYNLILKGEKVPQLNKEGLILQWAYDKELLWIVVALLLLLACTLIADLLFRPVLVCFFEWREKKHSADS